MSLKEGSIEWHSYPIMGRNVSAIDATGAIIIRLEKIIAVLIAITSFVVQQEHVVATVGRTTSSSLRS